MKTKLLVLLTVAMTSLQAAANPALITCVTENQKSFKFQLLDKVHLFANAQIYDGVASALHRMGSYVQELPTEILVTPMQTRTIVGFTYDMNLPGGAQVSLQHITYDVSAGLIGEISKISGVVKQNNGAEVNVNCTN